MISILEAKIANFNTNIYSHLEESSTDDVSLWTKARGAVKTHLSLTN